jgi:hypothetical protein
MHGQDLIVVGCLGRDLHVVEIHSLLIAAMPQGATAPRAVDEN